MCQPCLKSGRPTQATAVDHIVPKSQGGGDEDSNLQAICKPCHDAKTAAAAAAPAVYGLPDVVAGDSHFPANTDAYGIAVEAGHAITMTANGEFTYCPGGVSDAPIASHYRLVL